MSDLIKEVVESRLTTRKCFAATAGLSERHLDRLIAAKIVPVHRIGTAVLIDTEGARAGLAARKQTTTTTSTG
jgi:hypothetical protein